MILGQLFFEFFKIGLFAVGGGMAAIPFLKALADKTGWFTTSLITDMIAISESTPGPIGINMATYVGFNVAGVLGALIATLGTILPAIVIVTTVSRYLEKFSSSPLTDRAFYGLRPTVTGLIAAAGFDVMKVSLLQIESFTQGVSLAEVIVPGKWALFIAAFIAIRKFKKHPVLCIAVSAVIGILFSM